jgi:hypothetical protein
VCNHPFAGMSCAEKECYPACGEHGHCFDGQCLCKDVSCLFGEMFYESFVESCSILFFLFRAMLGRLARFPRA